jgi:hypothetical protein
VDGYRQGAFGRSLPDHVLIEMADDIARGRNVVEKLLGGTAPLRFLIQDRLAEFDTFTADVDIARPFHQWADVAIAFATEGTEGILLGRAGVASATWYNILTLRHNDS